MGCVLWAMHHTENEKPAQLVRLFDLQDVIPSCVVSILQLCNIANFMLSRLRLALLV